MPKYVQKPFEMVSRDKLPQASLSPQIAAFLHVRQPTQQMQSDNVLQQQYQHIVLESDHDAALRTARIIISGESRSRKATLGYVRIGVGMARIGIWSGEPHGSPDETLVLHRQGQSFLIVYRSGSL